MKTHELLENQGVIDELAQQARSPEDQAVIAEWQAEHSQALARKQEIRDAVLQRRLSRPLGGQAYHVDSAGHIHTGSPEDLGPYNKGRRA